MKRLDEIKKRADAQDDSAARRDADMQDVELMNRASYYAGFLAGEAHARTDLPLVVQALEVALEALTEISVLDPYPNTDRNIRMSHKRHLSIAQLTLAKITKLLEGG